MTLRASSHERVAWRCLYRGTFCPFHMGTRVHPSESLTAYYPDLAKQWHPTKNDKRPDEVGRGPAYEAQ